MDSLSLLAIDNFLKCISILVSKSALHLREIERSLTVEGIIDRSDEVLEVVASGNFRFNLVTR